MKLRLRSFDSRETLRIEVQNSCTPPQLKQILSQTLPNSPSPASIRLSLNRIDELQSDGEESLHSLGVAAGDLVFFSIEQSAAVMSSNSQNTLSPVDSTPIPGSDMAECSTGSNTHNTLPLSQNSDSVEGKIIVGGTPMENLIDEMEVDQEGSVNSYFNDAWVKSFSVPGFLRKVLREGLGDDGRPHHKLIIIAVHAVMEESGLVGLYRNSNVRSARPSGLYRISLFYTLPESLSPAARGKSMNSVVLKFQTVGKFMNVYGTLEDGSGKTGTHCVQLKEDRLLLCLNVIWGNCGQDGRFLDTSPEKEVFEFWRNIKDNLALPLLIDLCEEAGLELPPCFMRLPKDLKLKILELLPGVDVAKVSCLNSELQHLGSSDDLWKLKFAKEFSNEKKKAELSWRKAFATVWGRKNSSKLAFRAPIPFLPAPQYWRRHPNPFIVPRLPQVIGDELDIPPPTGGVLQSMVRGQVNRQMQRRYSPVCNLGGGGARFI